MDGGKNNIYLLYTCDAWKGTDSMRLTVATTSTSRLKKAIEDRLHAEDMVYGDEKSAVKEQLYRFRQDWKEMTADELNVLLKYGYIQEVGNGEII